MTTLTLYSAADAYIREPDPNTNYGTDTFLRVNNYASFKGRSLVKFNLPSYLKSASIQSVTLRLYCDVNTDALNKTHNIYRILRSDWVETEATWNRYKTLTSWTTAGAWDTTDDRSATLFGSTIITTAGWYEFTLDLDEFQLLLDNDQNSIIIENTSTSNVEFHSREDTNDPELVIEYTPGGVQAVWFA